MKAMFSTRLGARSTNQKIFFAAVTVGLVGMLAKAGITVKELIVAKMFGRGDDLDAFLIAFLLPSFIVNLVVGSLSIAFIPMFIEAREKQGAEAAQKLFSSLLCLLVVILVAMAAILGLLAPYYLPFLGSNFSPAKLLLTRRLLCWILPFVLFNGVSVFISAALNAGERFALPALFPDHPGDHHLAAGHVCAEYWCFFPGCGRGCRKCYRSRGFNAGFAIVQLVYPGCVGMAWTRESEKSYHSMRPRLPVRS